MKKVLALSLAVILLICFAACGGSKVEPYEGQLTDLVTAMYEKQPVEFMVGPAMEVDLSDAWAVQSYLGLGAAEDDGAVAAADENAPAAADENAPAAADENEPAADINAPAAMPEEEAAAPAADYGIKEAYFSESMIGAQAYSLVVARVSDTDKIEEIKKAMFEGIDTRKWICVEADQLRVVSCKDVIMLVMASSQLAEGLADGMVNAFAEAISGGEVDDAATVLSGEILKKG